jgi:nucleoside-diphosphate-sugar epimerase
MASSTAIPPAGLVLITGVNGFLASHVAIQLLSRGYAVRGTVRTLETASWISDAIIARIPADRQQQGPKLEIRVVPSLSAPGIMEELISDVDGIAYMAADTSLNTDPNQVITPGLEALQSALAVAAQSPSVKRFVFTSSYTAAVDTSLDWSGTTEVLVKADSWNTTSGARAWAPPPYDDPRRALSVYQSLKTESERLFWSFAEESKQSQSQSQPRFVRNAVLPGCVLGPIIHPKQRGSTAAMVKVSFDDPASTNQWLGRISAPWVVDVVDNALLHVAALTEEDVKNERLLALADPFSLRDFVAAFKTLDPSGAWPAYDRGHQTGVSWLADTRRPSEILQRFNKDYGFTPFEESVKRNCLESDPSWKFWNFMAGK